MPRIVCPACARRATEIVTHDCAVCAEDGVLNLHPAAVDLYTVEVVADAVSVAFEACARVIDDGTLLSAPQADLLADKVADLVTGRLIYFPEQETAAAAPALAPVVPIRRARRGKMPRPDLLQVHRHPQSPQRIGNTMQKPTVGRIVHYQSYGTPGGENLPQTLAAIITPVGYGVDVSLRILSPTGQFFNELVHFSETPEPGRWNWPPRD